MENSENNKYNKTELSRVLAKKSDKSQNTIRRALTEGWSIEEILNTKKNQRRYKK